MKVAYYAEVHENGEIKKIHFVGLPKEIGDGNNDRMELDTPIVVIIVTDSDESGFMLYRYNLDKECVGDTWHMSIDDAMYQADYEYKIGENDWRKIPDDVVDNVDFAFREINN